MTKAQYAMLICTLCLSSVSVADPAAPSRKECISPLVTADREHYDPAYTKVNSPAALLEYEQERIPHLCARLMQEGYGPVSRYAEPGAIAEVSDCLMVVVGVKSRREAGVFDLGELQFKCINGLTAQEVVDSNEELTSNYRELLNSEAAKSREMADKRKTMEKELADKQKTEKAQKEAIELARRTERSFDVKSLHLNLNRQQIIDLAGAKLWQCHHAEGDPSVEECVLELAQLVCTKVPLTDPRTGGPLVDGLGRQVMVNRDCGQLASLVDNKQLSPDGKKLVTVGGQHVLNIVVGLFDGVPSEFSFLLAGPSADLESGLVEKFGKPTIRHTNRLEWLSKDENLEYLPKEAKLHVFNPKKIDMANKQSAKFIADRKKAELVEAQRKAQLVSGQKRKDL